MQRISVIGTSGSGKSSFARRLAVAVDAPVIELDAAYHQPDWEPLDPADFRVRIAAATSGDRWVVDGNYSIVRDLVWAAADTVVWLDTSRARVMTQVATRTLGRMATGRELWNGNRERWRNLVRLDREENIVLWAWTTFETNRSRYGAAMVDPTWRHIRFLRIRTRAEARGLVRVAEAEAPVTRR